MGTRAKPGRFDCHAVALPDEPLFTLLGRDPLAGFLVSIWSSMRFGDVEAAQVKFRTMLDRIGPDYWVSPDVDKGGEAMECALAMFVWREQNLGCWKAPQPPAEPSAVEKALGAAVMALRSYQHGNSAPDLAAEIADAGGAALAAAGFPTGYMARDEA